MLNTVPNVSTCITNMRVERIRGTANTAAQYIPTILKKRASFIFGKIGSFH